jgi:hypothetical protein
MLWFLFRKKPIDIESKSSDEYEPIHKIRSELLDLLANDAQMRIWLPEPLRLAMDQVARHLDTTLSKYLREYFVVYLYGNHVLIDMYKNQTGIFYKPPNKEAIEEGQYDRTMFSRARSVECIPGLGKNIVPLKIFLNAQIKTDLQMLADQSGVALSHFVREILVSHFLGHTVWPERQQMLDVGNISIANQWETGDLNAHTVRQPSAQEEAALEGRIEVIYL